MKIILKKQRRVDSFSKIFFLIFLISILFSNVESNCLSSGSGGCYDSGCGKLSNFKTI